MRFFLTEDLSRKRNKKYFMIILLIILQYISTPYLLRVAKEKHHTVHSGNICGCACSFMKERDNTLQGKETVMRGISMKLVTFALLAAFAFMYSGCGSRTATGGAVGAGAGGAVGAAVGSRYGSTIRGALIGAAIGGAAGALIGRYMDRQAEAMKKELENARIERVAEGIRVTFESGILFDFDSAELRATARNNLRDFADILRDYPNTNILIEGHTDAIGTNSYNQDLSERRARSVGNYLSSLGVERGRFVLVGYGETQPVASNENEQGRQQNRRVEVGIMANEDLKSEARDAAKEGRNQL
jgi:outer membrane protein OmpA-like peptidoglycan-associated protein